MYVTIPYIDGLGMVNVGASCEPICCGVCVCAGLAHAEPLAAVPLACACAEFPCTFENYILWVTFLFFLLQGVQTSKSMFLFRQ